MQTSGLQFYSLHAIINPRDRIIPAQYFWQHRNEFGGQTDQLILDRAHQLSDGTVVPRQLLDFDKNGEVIDANMNTIPSIPQEELIIVNKMSKCVEQYQEIWLPIPYFKYNPRNGFFNTCPVAWSRAKICNLKIETNEDDGIKLSFEIVLAFDTQVHDLEPPQDAFAGDLDSSTIKFNPLLTTEDTTEMNNIFKLCADTDLNIAFVSGDKKWRLGR